MSGLGRSRAFGAIPAVDRRAEAPQGAWIEKGLIDAGGSHEPYLFVVRRGGQRLDAREIYEREKSEEVIRKLRDQGVEVFHTHLYKGFGMAAEMPQMEDTVQTAAIVHRLGMKIDTYIQWDSLMYETFFAEEPRAQSWIQCDAFGQPIMLEYGYQQSFRYLPCFSNQEYLDYLKKVVRYAVVDVKTDFIHFDNFTMSAEPYSCHCPACKAGFRNYLRSKYSSARRKERFGFENVDYVNPPLWNADNRPEKMRIVSDPVFQEWIDYRCQTMANGLSQMAELVRSLNPEVVLEINYGGVVGYNSPWIRGTDAARLLPNTQVFWDESDLKPELLPDGRLITSIRTYKMARTYRNVVLSYISVGEAAMAECLAFNQTIGFAGVNPLPAEVVKYIAFYRKHRDLYVATEDLAPVAVLRSYPSITFNNAGAGLSAILFEQALIQSRVPFRIICDEHLAELSPSTCKVLVLSNTECLSDEQVAQIREFVAKGGGLVATEQTGFYDAWRRSRVEPGLHELLTGQRPTQHDGYSKTDEAGSRKQYGRGRAAYIPSIEFDGALPIDEPYFTIGPEFWKRPRNWKDLVDAVIWAGGELPVSVKGPEFLGLNVLEQTDKRRRILHFVNYNVEKAASIEAVTVRCAVEAGATPAAVQFYSPEVEDGRPLDFHVEDSQAVFEIPVLNAYGVAVIRW